MELRIAAEFATSQGPVREALRELEATGLVTNVPRRGTYVAAIVADGLREIYAVRGALEEQATRQATVRGSCDLAGAAGSVDAMRAAALAGDVPGVIEHSVAFHSAIMAAAGNRLLLNIWRSLRIETRTTITMLVDGLDLRRDRRKPPADRRRHPRPATPSAPPGSPASTRTISSGCRRPIVRPPDAAGQRGSSFTVSCSMKAATSGIDRSRTKATCDGWPL